LDTALVKLIRDYQGKVSEAVEMIEAAGIPRPASTAEWVYNGIVQKGLLPNGFRYFKHGFGCAVAGPSWAVDFDFGDSGQIDGFNASRLFGFAEKISQPTDSNRSRRSKRPCVPRPKPATSNALATYFTT
jgi:hypothetical protein